MKQTFAYIKHDLQASLVVFLVALPLCLGIALASETPMFSGIIAGIIGGVVVGLLSGSSLGVSGPAAGLVAIFLGAKETLGSWETFLLAGFIAGILQIIAGFVRGGIIAYYFPSAVIKGMLSGIGIIIILKQIPHLLGHDISPFLSELTNGNFHLIEDALDNINPGAVIISAVSLCIMIFWDSVIARKHKIFEILQAPLVVVLLGLLLVFIYENNWLPYKLEPSELVQIPQIQNIAQFTNAITFPNFRELGNFNVYRVAVVIAIVASLETLLCVEATDKLDPHRRVTPTNRELKAQGLGNMLTSLLGGLPITQVIVRSTANITFGAKTKLSTILHGVFLLVCVLSIPLLLNRIPLASLAAILIIIGYKLTSPSIFKQMYERGWEQFLPFIITVVGIVFNDLLFGIGLGFATSVFLILRRNYLNSHDTKIYFKEGITYHMELAEEVTFLNKGSITHDLKNIPNNATLIIDGSNSKYIDNDVKEVIENFITSAKIRDISVEVRGIDINVIPLKDYPTTQSVNLQKW